LPTSTLLTDLEQLEQLRLLLGAHLEQVQHRAMVLLVSTRLPFSNATNWPR